MTISTSSSKIVCLGNGATVVFSFGFLIPQAGEEQITFTDANGVQTVLNNTQYMLVGFGNANGGTVTYPLGGSPTPIPTGTSLTIARVLPLVQGTTISNQGAFYPQVVEGALDYEMMVSQQIQQEINQTVRGPIVDQNPIGQLPAAAQRAGKYFAFDSSGNPLMVAGAGPATNLVINGSSSGQVILNAQPTASGVVVLPNGNDTLVGRATIDTLSNKTFSDQPSVRHNLSVPVYVSDRTSLGNLDPTIDTVAAFDGSIWYAVAYSGVSTLVTADVAQGMYLRSVTNNAFAWVRQSDTIEIEFFNVQPYPADATVGLASAFAVFNILGRTITARAMYKSTARINLTNTFLDLRGVGEQQAGIVFTNSGGIKVDNSAYNTLYRPISIEKFSLIPTTLGLYNGLEVLGAAAAFENQLICDRLDTNPFLYGGTGYWANCVSTDANVQEAYFINCVMLVQTGHALPAYGITTNGGNLFVVDGGVYDGFTAAFNVTGTGSFVVKPGTFFFSCSNIGIRQGTETHLVMTGCHAYCDSGWVVSAGNHFFFADNFFIPKANNFIGFDVTGSFGLIHHNQIINSTLLAGPITGVEVRNGAANVYVTENIWYGLTNGVVVDTGASNTKVFDNEVTGGMTAASGLSDSGTGTQFRSATTTDFNFNKPLLPFTDGGAALGSTTKEWSNLYLASGGTINWANSNVILTHSTSTLALTGNFTATGVLLGHNLSVSGPTIAANGLYLPSAGNLGFAVGSAAKMLMTASALSPFASGGLALGTTALPWSGIFLASGAVANFGNGDYTVTHSTGTLTLSGKLVAGNLSVTATTIPTNGVYLPSANTLGWAINGAGSIQLSSSGFSPQTNGGMSLGQSTSGWSAAYFQAGATINFGPTGYSITHSTGVLTFNGAVLSSGTGGVGYATGAGGTVTQATSRTTGVTLNKTSGAITLFSAAGTTTPATFTVTNSAVAATDTIILNQKTGANQYVLLVTAVAAGSFNITLYALAGTATEAPVINFSILKGAAS